MRTFISYQDLLKKVERVYNYLGSPTKAGTSGGGGSSSITSLLGITTAGQKTMTNSLPVVIASDQSSFPVTIGAGSAVIGHVITDSGSVTNATLSAETTKVIGVVRTSDGAGNLLTTNSTTFTAKFALDTNLLGTLGTAFSTAGKVDVKAADGDVFVRSNAASTFPTQATLQTQTDTVMIGGVNIKEINAVTPLMGNGTTGTGSLRVTIASDNTAFSVNATLSAETTKVIGTVRLLGNAGAIVDGATAASVPANVIYQGLRGTTALPTAVSDGQLVGSMADKFGRNVSLISTIRDLVGTQTTTLSATTSETTIVTAGATGVFNDLIMLIVSNTSTATNTRIDFRDTTSGTVLFSLQSNGGQPPVGFALPTPIPQTTAATNWTAQCATSTTDIRIYAVFAKNK